MRSFDRDLREMVEANPDSLTDPVWEDDGVTVKLASGHRLQIWKSVDGVFFDMVVASAKELGKEHHMTPKKVYERFGFFTSSSFAIRGNDEIFYASAISAEKYSARRLESVTNRFIVHAEDFAGTLEEWRRRVSGGDAE